MRRVRMEQQLQQQDGDATDLTARTTDISRLALRVAQLQAQGYAAMHEAWAHHVATAEYQ